ncbi:MAG TPA: hypothetical protein VF185_00780 [Patescibacteria group bacterium]
MDNMNWVEQGLSIQDIKTVKDLSKEPIPGCSVVDSKDKVPQDESVVYLNGGHAENLPIGLIKNKSEIYYVKQVNKDTGKVHYSKHVAINVDGLIQNPLFKENTEAKDELFKGVYQQLGQTTPTQRLEVLVGSLKRSKANPTNERAREATDYLLGTIETILVNEYNQALAARKVLKAAGDYPTTQKGREITQEQVDRILKAGSLESQLEFTRSEIKKTQAA